MTSFSFFLANIVLLLVEYHICQPFTQIFLQGLWPPKMLKAIHAQESKKAARQKAKAVVEELRAMKLKEAAKKVEDGIEDTLAYCDFPSEHWSRIRTNNVIERLNREIRRRTRVVGSFPDGNSALMLVCARLRHVAGTQWGNKKYMNMKHLEEPLRMPPLLADFIYTRICKLICAKFLTLPIYLQLILRIFNKIRHVICAISEIE